MSVGYRTIRSNDWARYYQAIIDAGRIQQLLSAAGKVHTVLTDMMTVVHHA